MNKKKALKEAKDWIWPALMFAVYDCSDSANEAEKYQARFDSCVDDSVPIEQFVKENLYPEYLEGVVATLKEGDNWAEWQEELSSTPSELPIPFDEFKADLEKLPSFQKLLAK